MFKRIMSVLLVLSIMMGTMFTGVFAEGETAPVEGEATEAITEEVVTEEVATTITDYGIYLGEKALTNYCPGDIYAKAMAEGTKMVVITLAMYEDGKLTDLKLARGTSGEIKTPAITITEAKENVILKVCVVTNLDQPNADAVVKEYTGSNDDPSLVSFDETKYYRIENVMIGKYLYANGAEALYDSYSSRDNYLWQIVPNADGGVLLINKATGTHLTSAADGTKINCGDIDSRGLSAWEILMLNDDDMGIKNRRNKKYLAVDESSGFPRCNVSKQPQPKSHWQAHWRIVDSNEPVVNNKKEFSDYNAKDYDQTRTTMLTPGYYDDVSGQTALKFYAPQAAYILAKCFTANDKEGEYADIAVVPINDDGFGMFEMNFDEYPYGPLNISLYSYAGNAVNDICYLMVYNTSGIKFNYGYEQIDPVPQAVTDLGLTELFKDDFEALPNIMSTHTAGLNKYYGPVSQRFFSSWEHAMFQDNARPFTQRDTWLKITANIDSKGTSQGTTGYMASLNEGSHAGFAVSAPAYFECKFIAQNIQGAWPSFWLLNTQKGEGAKASVELDVIEAYGAQPDDAGRYVKDSDTYSTTSHGWSIGESAHKWHEMKELGNGCNWYQSEHAYGVLITETDTIYYLDGAEIFRHDNFVGSDEYFWFIINYAFGSGWKVNAERYGEIGEMYVDWVRVYGLEQNLMER